MRSRSVTVSMALIALICFFLPWVQLSCGASENRLSGVDLARDGHRALWLIPLLMLAVIFFATARAWQDSRQLSALVSGWFWLGLGSTIGLVALSALRLLKRPRGS